MELRSSWMPCRAFIDVGGNPSEETLGVDVNETVSSTPIVPISATVDYFTGSSCKSI